MTMVCKQSQTTLQVLNTYKKGIKTNKFCKSEKKLYVFDDKSYSLFGNWIWKKSFFGLGPMPTVWADTRAEIKTTVWNSIFIRVSLSWPFFPFISGSVLTAFSFILGYLWRHDVRGDPRDAPQGVRPAWPGQVPLSVPRRGGNYSYTYTTYT